MKKLFLGILLLIITHYSACGATFYINNAVNGGLGDILLENTNDTLAGGGIVSIGYFAGGLPSTNISNIATIISGYTSVHSVISGSNSVDLGGSYAGYFQSSVFNFGSITNEAPASNASLIGLNLYLFAGNAATLAGSTSFALLQVGVIEDDFPLTQAYVGNLGGSLVGNIGAIGSFTGAPLGGLQPSTTYNTIQLQAIPEPSTLILSALGVFALLRRRR